STNVDVDVTVVDRNVVDAMGHAENELVSRHRAGDVLSRLDRARDGHVRVHTVVVCGDRVDGVGEDAISPGCQAREVIVDFRVRGGLVGFFKERAFFSVIWGVVPPATTSGVAGRV